MTNNQKNTTKKTSSTGKAKTKSKGVAKKKPKKATPNTAIKPSSAPKKRSLLKRLLGHGPY